MLGMNRKNPLVIIILFTLCFGIITQVSAQVTEVQVGVKAGDTFKYEAIYYWNSTDSSAAPPASVVQQNATEWIQATIKSVTSNTVTIGEVQHFQNGTEVTLPDEITALGTTNQNSVLLYVANLNKGSYVLPIAAVPYYTVNDTQPFNYPGGARETNSLITTQYNVDVPPFDEENQTADYAYVYSERFFDRQTGVLVQGYFEYGSATTEGEAYAEYLKIIDSNVWTISGSEGDGNNNGSQLSLTPELLIVSAVIIVAVVAASLFLMMRRRRKKRQR